MLAIDWAAAAIPLGALIVAVASLLIGALGRQKDRDEAAKTRAEAASQQWVEQLEKRLEAETRRNDRLEDQLSEQNLRLLACEEARRAIMEDNARLMFFKVFGKEMPDGPGPIPDPQT